MSRSHPLITNKPFPFPLSPDALLIVLALRINAVFAPAGPFDGQVFPLVSRSYTYTLPARGLSIAASLAIFSTVPYLPASAPEISMRPILEIQPLPPLGRLMGT